MLHGNLFLPSEIKDDLAKRFSRAIEEECPRLTACDPGQIDTVIDACVVGAAAAVSVVEFHHGPAAKRYLIDRICDSINDLSSKILAGGNCLEPRITAATIATYMVLVTALLSTLDAMLGCTWLIFGYLGFIGWLTFQRGSESGLLGTISTTLAARYLICDSQPGAFVLVNQDAIALHAYFLTSTAVAVCAARVRKLALK
jgi:hypothetical protein